MNFDWKRFLIIAVVGVLIFGFIADPLAGIVKYNILGILQIGRMLAFGIAVFIAESVYSYFK